MKKVYILGPLIALGIFTFFYLGFAKEYEAQIVQQEADAKEARRLELLQEAEDRKQAIEAALALNAERKAEREAKEAEELAKKEARQAASDARESANREQSQLQRRVNDLKEQVAAVEEEIKTITADKTRLADEAKHLQSFVALADANVAKLEAVLGQIQAADAAAAAAAAAAAVATK